MKIKKEDRIWTIHCCKCLVVLAISKKNLQEEETYCLKCAKEEMS